MITVTKTQKKKNKKKKIVQIFLFICALIFSIGIIVWFVYGYRRQAVAYNDLNKRITELRELESRKKLEIHEGKSDVKEWFSTLDPFLDQYCNPPESFMRALKSAHGEETVSNNLASIFEALVKKKAIPNLDPSTVVATKEGQIIDGKLANGKKNIDWYQCDALTVIFQLGKDLGLAAKRTKNYFDKTDKEIWRKNKVKFASNTHLDEDVWTILKFLRHSNVDTQHGFEKNIEVLQMATHLLQKHCKSAVQFVEKQPIKNRKKQGNIAFLDGVLKLDVVLQFIAKRGEIEIGDDEMIVIDKAGDITAVKRSMTTYGPKTSEGQLRAFEDYMTCPLIDKLIYYKNEKLSQQVEDALNVLRNDNVYAFESKMDILMQQECHNVASKLRRQHDKTHTNLNIYDSIFRGNLLSFSTKIIKNEYISDERYMVSDQGGILSLHEIKKDLEFDQSRIFKCSLIDEIANNGQQTDDSGEIIKKEFDPLANTKDNHILNEELKHIKNEQQAQGNGQDLNDIKHHDEDIELDAKIIIQHALNKKKINFKRILHNMLNLYHNQDLNEMDAEKVNNLMTQIEQYAFVLTGKEWQPLEYQGTRMMIDKSRGILVTVDIKDPGYEELRNHPDLVESPLLTKIFEMVIKSETEFRKQIHYALEDE